MPRAPRRVSRATLLSNEPCEVSTFRLLAPVPVPRLPSVGNVEGSRSHHWLPWPSFGCPSSVGRGSEPLPCIQCNFLYHVTTKGASAHHSITVFTTTFSAYFSERRIRELLRIPLPRTPLNSPNQVRGVSVQ